MTFLVFFFMLGFVGLVGLFVAFGKGRSSADYKLPALAVVAAVGVLQVVNVAVNSVHFIPAGEVGIVRTFGRITGQVSEGAKVTWPWQDVQKWDVKVRKIEPDSQCSDGTPNCLDAFSAETQDVFVTAAVNIQVNPEDIQKLARTVGTDYDSKIVLPRLYQIIKDTTVQYSSVEIAPNREQIRQEVRERLNAELSQFSINVVDLLLPNVDFRPEFKQAIEDKQIATQQAQTEANKVAIAKAQADQEIATAEGHAKAVAADAQGNADRLRIEAEGQADANKQITQSLTPELIQWQAVQKLSDKVQIALLPSGQGIIIDPGTLLAPSGLQSPGQ